tara:strand:+ start:1125 stop:2168 length:1044 start_codon:yes stop_codon:yes gene_type:complete
MAITVVLEPGKSDDHFLQQFSGDTRFCIIPEHYNTSPLGWPNQKFYLEGNTPLPEQIMKSEPNIQFITNFWREDLLKLPNVKYHGFGMLNHHRQIKGKVPPPKKQQDLKCANMLGGRTRINRLLAGHWLAKHFPLEKLIFNWIDNDSLTPIQDVINMSPHYNRSHIKSKTFLPATFISGLGQSNEHRLLTHFIPQLFNKSIVSIIIETMGIEMNNDVDEKSLYPMAGKCLVFHTGCFQVDNLLKRIGFNVFEDVFDLSHLQCEDRYGLTILGLENNKNILCNLEYLIETYHAHQKEIEHNYEMACVNNDLENFFQPTSITIKEACKYIDPSVIARLNVELKATPLIA